MYKLYQYRIMSSNTALTKDMTSDTENHEESTFASTLLSFLAETLFSEN